MTQVDKGPESLGVPDVLTVGGPSVGEVLADRYQLEVHVNNDNFDRQVWRGVDVVLRRPVAVVLRYPGGAAAVEMLDAAVAASRVEHPNLVDIYDAIDEGQRAYVVREWVDGSSLRDLVLPAPLEPEQATTIACGIARAVAAFHATGMVHGNIHPGTVLVGADGRVLLADARSDEAATPDTDVRAVGAVLYAALTGHWPIAEAGAARMPDAMRDQSGAIIEPRQIRGGVPGHLSDLATDLLDPKAAPPSADVLAADLGRLDAEREDEYLIEDQAMDFDGGLLAVPHRPEQHRPIGRKLAVGIVGLLVLAAAGLILATRVLPSAGQSAAPAPTTTSPTGVPTPTGKTRALAIPASQVRIVDPNGDRSELKNAALAVDGKPGTFWKTDHYQSSPLFGGRKAGMGILLDLGSPQQVSDVEVDFTNIGATVELRAGNTDSPATAAGDQQVIQTFTVVQQPVVVQSTHDFLVSGDDPPVRFLLVWISSLPTSADDPNRYQVGISEIKVNVTG